MKFLEIENTERFLVFSMIMVGMSVGVVAGVRQMTRILKDEKGLRDKARKMP